MALSLGSSCLRGTQPCLREPQSVFTWPCPQRGPIWGQTHPLLRGPHLRETQPFLRAPWFEGDIPSPERAPSEGDSACPHGGLGRTLARLRTREGWPRARCERLGGRMGWERPLGLIAESTTEKESGGKRSGWAEEEAVCVSPPPQATTCSLRLRGPGSWGTGHGW